jgi:hypothetical protein
MISPPPTTKRQPQPPRFWTRRTVLLATRALPRGPLRDRYQQELVAELYAMTGSQQTSHALGVLAHSFALRAAIAGDPALTEEAPVKKPYLCRTHLHHVYRTASTEDGSRYRRCVRCGKEDWHLGDSVGRTPPMG